MRAVELLKELEAYMHFESRGFKTSFGDNLTLVRDDSIKAYVFEKSSRPISIGDLKTIFKRDFFLKIRSLSNMLLLENWLTVFRQ